jgi:hypothetical protein
MFRDVWSGAKCRALSLHIGDIRWQQMIAVHNYSFSLGSQCLNSS